MYTKPTLTQLQISTICNCVQCTNWHDKPTKPVTEQSAIADFWNEYARENNHAADQG